MGREREVEILTWDLLPSDVTENRRGQGANCPRFGGAARRHADAKARNPRKLVPDKPLPANVARMPITSKKSRSNISMDNL